jgi:Tfp pilus assembly protein FimT
MELIVVLFILGLMAAFAVPNFGGRMFRDDTETFINWVVFNAGRFKKEAKLSRSVLVMGYHPEAHRFLVKKETPEQGNIEEDLDNEAENHVISDYQLPDGIRIEEIRVNGTRLTESESGIRFYPKGYSDHALIYISNDNNREYTLVIEPFLQRVAVHQGEYRFD